MIKESLLIIFLCLTHSYPKRKENDRRELRAIVPQLLPNYTTSTLPPANQVGCNTAWLSCRYRDGCGSALQHYMTACDTLVSGNTTKCDVNCRLSLTALISTHEGERLMKCECEDEDCKLQKHRVEPCRSSVQDLTSPDSVVSCTTASYICMAEPGCSTALQYYNNNCMAMFEGRKCNKRCKNSIEILMKQEQSKKLTNCICDGTETYDCENIRHNMERLCYNKTTYQSSTNPPVPPLGEQDPELSTESNVGDSAHNQSVSPYLMISILAPIFNGYLGNVLKTIIVFYFH